MPALSGNSTTARWVTSTEVVYGGTAVCEHILRLLFEDSPRREAADEVSARFLRAR